MVADGDSGEEGEGCVLECQMKERAKRRSKRSRASVKAGTGKIKVVQSYVLKRGVRVKTQLVLV